MCRLESSSGVTTIHILELGGVVFVLLMIVDRVERKRAGR